MRLIISFNNKNCELPAPWIPQYTVSPFGMKVYDGDINVQRRINYYSDCVIYYLIDSYSDNNWTVLPVDSVGINVNSGSTIYFYGPSTNRISRENGDGRFIISGTGKVDLIGNFLSLCNPNWTENMKLTSTLNNNTGLFCWLFASLTNIYNAKDMYIRTDEITCGYLYGIAFGYMFSGCTNLLTGPTWICNDNKLSIAGYAQFISMFSGCTNLKTVTLPPITTYSYHYSRQFETMLRNCSSLETIYYDGVYPINSTITSKNFSNGMNTIGDFYNLKNATISRDVNGIPSGWTIHTSL